MFRKQYLIFIMLVSVPFLSKAQAKPKFTFNHAAIYVTDLKRTGEFYTQVIGLDTIPEPFHDGRHIWLDIGFGRQMHIIQGAGKEKEYFQNNHLCFNTPDVLGFTKLLENKSITWFDAKGNPNKITTRVDGVLQVFLKDPDGYWIEVNNAK
jgi:lactoylglutathione lyase